MRARLLFLAVLGCNQVDVASAPVGAGAVPIALPVAGEHSHAGVVVDVSAPVEPVEGNVLAVEPPAITIPAGRNQIFVAAKATSWRVVEDGGGSIDAKGQYVAPNTPGTYHVVATDGASTGTATVNVVRMDVSIFTGALGGFGNIDGVGAGARLSMPSGIAHDVETGTLYVTDPPLLRKIDLATGMVTTLATWDYPTGLAFHAAKKTLYVSDPSAHAIRALDVSTGAVSTLPMTDFPTGLCLIGNTLYVSDPQTSVIRTVDLDTKEERLLAGQTNVFGYEDAPDPRNAIFNRIYGIACGPSTVYVADFNSHVIRTIDQSGTATQGAVTTIAGVRTVGAVQDGDALSEARFGNVHSIAFDNAHSMLYVGEWGRKSIRAIDLTKSRVSTQATLGQPGALATNGSTVWVGDQTNSELRTLDIQSSAIATLAGKGGVSSASELHDPSVLALGADTLYVGEPSNVHAISLSTGVVAPVGAPLKGVAALTLAPTGDVWIADPTRFLGPHGAAWAGGKYYVTDATNIIRVVDPANDIITTLSSPLLSYQALGLASNGTDKLWVTERSVVREIDLVTGAMTTLAGTPGAVGTTDGIGTEARFNTPWGLLYDGHGSLYVADTAASTIRRIWLATGAVSTIAGQPNHVGVRLGSVQTATINHPRGLAVTEGGTILVTSEQAVLRIGAF